MDSHFKPTLQRYSNFIFTAFFLCLFSLNLSGQNNRLDSEFMLEDLRKLSHDAAEGRKSGTKGAEAARRFIIKQMQDMRARGFNRDMRHDFEYVNRSGDSIQGVNVISYIKGKGEKAIVITAHYDHLGIRNDKIYNGADDNASGVSAMLAFIEYFKANKPNYNLIFAALDGEEDGLKGAQAFMKDESIPIESIVLNINMDMISINDKNELYVAGTHHYKDFRPILEKVDPSPIKLRFGHDSPDLGSNDWTFQSDHGVFHRSGIPFLYFGVEDHEHYHKPTDTFENIDQGFFINAAHVILDCIIAVDQNLN